jgi:hypothetical protein
MIEYNLQMLYAVQFANMGFGSTYIRVHDTCRRTGKFRGAAHNRCNITKYNTDVFDIDNVKSIESDNIYGINSTVSIKIKDMPFPVHTIHWKATNMTAYANNYLSNYTTCAEDHTKGESPIKWASLSSQQGILFKNLESYICEKIVPYKNFGKIPKFKRGNRPVQTYFFD